MDTAQVSQPFDRSIAMNDRTTSNSRPDSAALALTDAELDTVTGGKDYDLGFGIHLVNMGSYWNVYTDAKGPVVAT
jgi:hypothetical protein